MSLFRIAWRSIRQRHVASMLTTLTMALGVMLVVAVLLALGIVGEFFRTNSSLGYNMIVGAKGGKLQLVLNTVYYLSSPVENVPYTFYEEFLPAARRLDGRDGRYAERTRFVIPLCLGDYFQGYRVVGTTPALFDDYVYDAERQRKYEFASGRNFHTYSAEHGFFEAVVGAKVARDCRLRVGDRFSPTHGPEGDTHDEFFVVGVLKPSGTPNDRAVFVNMEGFYLLEGHAKEPAADGESDATGTEVPPADSAGDAAPTDIPPDVQAAMQEAGPGTSLLAPERQSMRPLSRSLREVTAMLVRTEHGLMTLGIKNDINEGKVAQAVLPIQEITALSKTFVEPMQALLLVITSLICLISGVSILVSIYNSMNDRQHEIAVMRALGASRSCVLWIVLLESILLSLGGGFLGWLGGHALVGGVLRGLIEDRTGVSIGFFDLAPPVNLLELLGASPIIRAGISPEFLLIPALIVLAILVGLLPALTAYRTDVARALSATP